MSPWERLLEHPHSRGHFVQLYQASEGALTCNVGRYLWEGLRSGDGELVIATAQHREAFSAHLNRLGANIPALTESGQLVLCDAHDTLSRFMDAGQPDWHRFEQVIRGVMRQVHPAGGVGGLRAYGEMVGLLWKDRKFAAALRLEQLWNKLLEQSSFSLYCAYEIDIFSKDLAVSNLEGILRTHTHLVPAQPDGHLDAALNRSMDEILGADADRLRAKIKASHRPGWAVMPTAENLVLWLRKNLPDRAEDIVSRARLHYQLASA